MEKIFETLSPKPILNPKHWGYRGVDWIVSSLEGQGNFVGRLGGSGFRGLGFRHGLSAVYVCLLSPPDPQVHSRPGCIHRTKVVLNMVVVFAAFCTPSKSCELNCWEGYGAFMTPHPWSLDRTDSRISDDDSMRTQNRPNSKPKRLQPIPCILNDPEHYS